MPKTEFKLDLTILESSEFDGPFALLAVEDGNDGEVILHVQSGGFPPSEAGAALLADMLYDAAVAIAEKLGHKLPRGNTDQGKTNPDTPRRPAFNPKPRMGTANREQWGDH